MTLLAFGAGAPDVFASLSASEAESLSGIFMGISVLLGSSLFILACVTALVLQSSPVIIKMNKPFFLRDCVFLFASYGILLYAVLIHGMIDFSLSMAFIGLYISYVLTVLVLDKIYEKTPEQLKAAENAMIELDTSSKYNKRRVIDLKHLIGSGNEYSSSDD